MKSILLESIENESSDDINLFDVFENLMNDAMDKTRKEDLKKVFKLLKELNIDEEIIYQKVSETFAAISLTSLTLFHCSSLVSKFPSSVEAKPHCGDSAN